jgi:hypothetical protein
MKTIKDLKAMIAQPASKEWFKKHGSPKHKALKRANLDPDYKRQVREGKEEDRAFRSK